MKEGGNSAGIEVQLLDDRAEQYQNLKDYQFTGSLYAVAPARERVGRPAGEWNTLGIACRGQHYTVTHNGVVIADADESSFPALAERNTTGYLGLQNHGGGVWLRSIRIRSR